MELIFTSDFMWLYVFFGENQSFMGTTIFSLGGKGNIMENNNEVINSKISSDAESLLQSIHLAAEKNSEKIKICGTKSIEEIADLELKTFLKELYHKKPKKVALLASIINASFTEGKGCFLFSKKIAATLFKNDSNLKNRSLSGQDFKELCHFFEGNGFLRRLRDGTKIKAGSIVELAHPNLIKMFTSRFGSEALEKQRKTCVDLFEGYLNKDGTSNAIEVVKIENSNAQCLFKPGSQSIENQIALLFKTPELTDWETDWLKDIKNNKLQKYKKLTAGQTDKLGEIFQKYHDHQKE